MSTPLQVRLDDYQPRQELAHDTLEQVDELLYGGAAYGGKTEFGIRYFAQFALRYPGVRIAVFRENLDEHDRTLIPRFRRLVDPCCVGSYRSDRSYRFDNSSVAHFLHCEHEAALEQYDTEEWAGLWLEEGSQFSRKIARGLRARLRSSVEGVPTRFLVTTNPDGIGNDWLVEEFVDPDPAGTGLIHEETVSFTLPNGQPYTGTKRRAFIQAFATDNPRGLRADPNYMFTLYQLDEDERRAKLFGDWTRPSGQFFKAFSRGKHVIDPITPPAHWPVWRALDFGYDPDPLVCLWLTQDPESSRIFVYQELWHTRLTDPEAKRLICEMSADRDHWTTWADPAGKQAGSASAGVSTWQVYSQPPDEVPLLKANNRRDEGWRAVRAGLRDLEDGKPAVQITSNCYRLLASLPKLVYHKLKTDDIADRQNDHGADCLRYGLLTRVGVTPALATARPKPKVEPRPKARRPRLAFAGR